MSLTRTDYIIFAVLFVLALFIWLRNTLWMTTSDDTLPILVAIPLFYWIGAPWIFRPDPQPLSINKLTLTVVLFLVGIGINSTLILAIGWTLLLWTWLSARLVPEKLGQVKKLLVLPLMAFPWISLDADRIGWWFRLSGAWATAGFFSFFGSDVTREGTIIVVNGTPISVEVACAGLNTLQSMLIAGTLVAYLTLGNTDRYWWNLPVLIGMSWLANTVRIIVITFAAVKISKQFATGAFHQIGGWAVLVLMFCMCWFIFYIQEPKQQRTGP